MSLDKLLQELCPDGVPYKKLGEIATDIYRGSGIKREQITPKGIPCVRYGEIYTTYGIWFSECVSHTDATAISSPKYFEHGDILFVITGESVEDIAKSTAYVGHERCLAGGDIVVLTHTQNPKYLSYALATTDARKQKSSGKVKSKVVHSSVPAIKDIVIPVPPLSVQSEIVRILDNFTELIAELMAELTARRKQYKYYRDKLLTVDFLKERANSVVWRTLGEIADIKTGKKPETVLEAGLFEYINAGTSNSGYTNDFCFSEDTVTTPSRGQGGIGFVGYQKRPFWLGPLCYGIRAKDSNIACNKFLYYFLFNNSEKIMKKKNEGGTPALNLRDLQTIRVPLLPISIQQHIVTILDRFDILCNDPASGLPAEIAARQKQYEYYRDKLLTFKELTA